MNATEAIRRVMDGSVTRSYIAGGQAYLQYARGIALLLDNPNHTELTTDPAILVAQAQQIALRGLKDLVKYANPLDGSLPEQEQYFHRTKIRLLHVRDAVAYKQNGAELAALNSLLPSARPLPLLDPDVYHAIGADDVAELPIRRLLDGMAVRAELGSLVTGHVIGEYLPAAI